MNEITSINQFFSQIGCHFQCYDMSRLIQKIDTQTLIDFEQTNTAWKTPFTQHAWLAIVFWTPDNKTSQQHQEHHVWFLKLPLDEQAKLNLAARDDFLRRLFAALKNYLQQSNAIEKLQSLENAMKDNPYGFQPKPEQMANFHAIVHQHLSLPASQYYLASQQYFSITENFESWQDLSLQGIADITARLDESFQNISNEQLLCEAVPGLPVTPYQILGNCLEHHAISSELTQVLFDRVLSELETNKIDISVIIICIASIRASAQTIKPLLQQQLIEKILDSDIANQIEILATISARCWQQLSHPELLSSFLEALARTEHAQKAFSAIISDLMFVPGMREPILQAFRSPKRSEQLAQAIGDFFKQL